MLYRVTKTVIFPILFTFFLLESGSEARNYVMLSITKDGLRELRLSYRGRSVLETSLASEQTPGSLVFSRASDGIRLVETVIRYGTIDDCIVSSHNQDIRSFSSEFSELHPGSMADTETDIMDVYLGVKTVTDSVFLAEHSKNSSENIFNSSAGLSKYKYVLSESNETIQDYFGNLTNFKLSAKIFSAKKSLFMQMLKPYLQIQKNARECRLFYAKATESLEMLSELVQQVPDVAQTPRTVYLNKTGADIMTRHHHRSHNHHHHRRNLHLDDIKENNESKQKQQRKFPSKNTPTWLLLNDTPESDSVHDTRRNEYAAKVNGHLYDTIEKDQVTDTSDSDDVYKTGQIVNIYRTMSSVKIESKSETESSKISGKESSIQNLPRLSSSTSSSSLTSQTSPSQTSNKTQVTSENIATSYGTFTTASVPSGNSSVVDNSVNNSKNKNNNTNREGLYGDHGIHNYESTDDLVIHLTGTHGSHGRAKRDLFTGWMIFPGTKWCGDGDIAEHKKDVGYHVELDKCCRRHDLCPLVIPRLAWRYGMFNYRLHTLSHCRCDRKFRKCLKASTSPLAHLIGQIYFNVVGPQCFKFTQKSTCVQRFWWGGCREWGDTKVAFPKKQRSFK